MRLHRPRPRHLVTAILAAVVGVFLVPLSTPVGAGDGASDCPSSVDTTSEGWVCMVLNLNVPYTPSEDGVALWEQNLNEEGRVATADGIIFSSASIEAKVQAVYGFAFGRTAERDAVDYWTRATQQSGTEIFFERQVFASSEFKSQFESFEAFLDEIYQYYLGRSPDEAGRDFWTDQYTSGAMNEEQVTYRIATGPEAGDLRANILYLQYARRGPDSSGHDYWSARAEHAGLMRTAVSFASTQEPYQTLGARGMCLADGSC